MTERLIAFTATMLNPPALYRRETAIGKLQCIYGGLMQRMPRIRRNGAIRQFIQAKTGLK